MQTLLVLLVLSVTPAPTTYHDYRQVAALLDRWHKEAPNVTDYSNLGAGVLCLRVTNRTNKPAVLCVAGVHGNEVMGSMLCLQFASKVLEQQDLLEKRQFLFVPIVSPESYPSRREVQGLDPNRNFPSRYKQERMLPSTQAVCKLARTIKPQATVSLHCAGRAILIPWGDTNDPHPDHGKYMNLAQKMSGYCGYTIYPMCRNYGHPIFGTENDFFAQQGAWSVLMETGMRMGIPSDWEIARERTLAWPAFLWFALTAPEMSHADHR